MRVRHTAARGGRRGPRSEMLLCGDGVRGSVELTRDEAHVEMSHSSRTASPSSSIGMLSLGLSLSLCLSLSSGSGGGGDLLLLMMLLDLVMLKGLQVHERGVDRNRAAVRCAARRSAGGSSGVGSRGGEDAVQGCGGRCACLGGGTARRGLGAEPSSGKGEACSVREGLLREAGVHLRRNRGQQVSGGRQLGRRDSARAHPTHQVAKDVGDRSHVM